MMNRKEQTMKAVIADDEFFVRKNILAGVDWISYGFTELIECNDGTSAVQAASDPEVILLITDIRMPGMDGIASIRALRVKRPELNVIIISGYPEKDYFKEAIHLGVLEFLEKPVDMEELQSCLKRISERMLRRNRTLSDQKLAENVANNRRRELIAAKLLRPFSPSDHLLLDELQLVNFPLSGLFYTCVISHYADTLSPERVMEQLCSFFPDEKLSLLCCRYHDLLVFHFAYEAEPLYFSKLVSRILNDCLLPLLLQDNQIPVIGLSSMREDIESIPELYAEATAALQEAYYLRDGYISKYREEGSAFDPTALYQKVQLELTRLDFSLAEKELQSLYDQFLDHSKTLPRTALAAYCQIADTLYETTREKNLHVLEAYETRYELTHQLEQFHYLRDLQNFLLQILKEISEHISMGLYGNAIVDDAAHFILTNFNDPSLSVQSTADYVHVAPNYLSSLFKKYIGETINQYIILTRIGKAKEYLMNPDLSINDVSNMTGFRDSGYFSKVFFRYTHITPSEYRRRRLS